MVIVYVILTYSVVSAGGTRRVRRRRRNADGTYGTDEEYHSDESIAMRRAAKKKKKKKQHGSDSEYRYASSSIFISQIRKPAYSCPTHFCNTVVLCIIDGL